jgi:hypothetical protein
MTQTTQEEFLWGSAPTAKFENIGDRTSGIVLAIPVTRPQTDFTTGQIKTWPSGETMEQMVIRLLTQERTDADDDGTRTLYIDTRFKKDALREALKLVGAKRIEVGGFIDMVHTELGGQNGTGKLYAAQYAKPTQQTLALVEAHKAEPQQPAQQQAPQPQQQWGGQQPQMAQGFPQAAPQQYPPMQPQFAGATPPPIQAQQPQASQGFPVPPPQPPQQAPPNQPTPEIYAAIKAAGHDVKGIYPDYDGRYGA